jgi:hypothetical protein
MKKLKVLALIFLVSAFSFSQSINVTFQVDMSIQMYDGNFPPGANVIVRGDFQTDAGDPNGNWQGNLFLLTDVDDDSIYSSTFPIPSNFVGNNYSFKYVIVNPPAGDNWESTLDRQFTLTSPSTVIPLDCFNHECGFPPPLGVTNTINFTADISSFINIGIGGAFDPYQDSLLVMGLDWDNLGMNVVGNRKMENTNPFNPGIYTTTLTVTSGSAAPNGVGDSTNWKFKAYPDSRFQSNGWEMSSDRWHIYEADGSTVTLPFLVPLILPIMDTTTIDIDLTINVDMLGAVNRYNGLPIQLTSLEFVGMRGGADFLGNWNMGGCWCVNDTLTGNMKVLSQVSSSIWSYNIIIPAGSVEIGGYQYKFAAVYPGADTVNGGINPLDNESGFGANHTLLISNTPTIIRNNYFGDGTPPNVERIENLLPSDYQLEQNYPNPFNPSTKIRYSIPELNVVTLKVFNLLGEEIETLVNGEQSAGVYEATFDASQLTSGVYFYKLKTKNFTFSKKMLLVR